MSKIILLSGGMDSFINWRLFHYDAVPVFVRTGSRYQEHDLRLARMQSTSLIELDMPKLSEQSNGVVPHRNIILLGLVANRTSASSIVVSAPLGEVIHDQQPRFYKLCSEVLGIPIVNSLSGYTKSDLVSKYIQNFSDRKFLNTRSCYSSAQGQCGNCPACFKRWVALTNNGIREHYTNNPKEYIKTLRQQYSLVSLLTQDVKVIWQTYKALKNAT